MFRIDMISYVILFYRVVFGLYLLNGHVNPLLCGRLKDYNQTTHTCVDGNVVQLPQLLCGNLQKYDPTTGECKMYNIIDGSGKTGPQGNKNDGSGETGENKTKHELVCGDLLRYDPIKKTCKSYDIKQGNTIDSSEMTGEIKTTVALRSRFCGQQNYEPAYATCCIVNTNKYKIYIGPEKNHICCGVDKFRRGSKRATCLNASMNDRLFHARRLRRNRKICIDYTQGYRLDIKGRMDTGTDSYFNATLTRVWNLSSKNRIKLTKHPRKSRTKTVRIKLDKNSPKRKIVGKSFLVFTFKNYNSITEDESLYISHSDKVYMIPSQLSRMIRTLRKFRKSCRSRREPG